MVQCLLDITSPVKGRVGVRKKCQLAVFNQCYAQLWPFFTQRCQWVSGHTVNWGVCQNLVRNFLPQQDLQLSLADWGYWCHPHTACPSCLECARLRKVATRHWFEATLDFAIWHWTLQSDIGHCNLTLDIAIWHWTLQSDMGRVKQACPEQQGQNPVLGRTTYYILL